VRRSLWVLLTHENLGDHSSRRPTLHYLAMKVTQKQTQAVHCPTCGAKPGETCELTTGRPRTEPHRDRRLAASEK
jgi:hypothetical protein